MATPTSPMSRPSRSASDIRALMEQKMAAEGNTGPNSPLPKPNGSPSLLRGQSRSPVTKRTDSAPAPPPKPATNMNGPGTNPLPATPTVSPGPPSKREGLATKRSPPVPPSPSTPVPQATTLQLKMPSGSALMVNCGEQTTAQDLIKESFSKISELLDKGTTADHVSLSTDEHVPINPSDIVYSVPSVKKATQNKDTPILWVKVDNASAPPLPPTPTESPINTMAGLNKTNSDTDLNNGQNGSTPRQGPPPLIPRRDSTSTIAPALPPPISRTTSSLFKERLSVAIANGSARPGAASSIGFSALKRQLREFTVQFVLPGGQTPVLNCKVDSTITMIKEELHKDCIKYHLLPMDHYFLKTPPGEFLTNEAVVLSQNPYVESCRVESTVPRLILVEKTAALSKKEKIVNKEIGSLIGTPISWANNDNEISQFRKSMMWVRFQEKKDKKEDTSAESPASPNPASPASTKVYIKLRLPLIESTLERTVIAMEGESANAFLEKMFKKHYEKPLTAKGIVKKYSDFVLKATGFADYISGSEVLTSFNYVKTCLAKGQEIRLSLVESEQNVDENNELYIEDFPDEQFLQDPLIIYDHDEIKSTAMSYDLMTHISLWELNRPFKFKIVGVENVKFVDFDKIDSLYITAGIYHGGELMGSLMTSSMAGPGINPRWYEWQTSNIQMCNLARAARICFTLFARTSGKTDDQPLGWVSVQLVDYKHELRTGLMSLNMWPDAAANPIGTCVSNFNSNSATLFVEFETFTLPVAFPTESKVTEDGAKTIGKLMPIKAAGSPEAKVAVDRLANTDPLYPLTEADKKMLWEEREYCKTKPRSLPKFVNAVTHSDRGNVQIMHDLLTTWPLIDPVDALELLDSKYGDSKVRAYAVKCLEPLTDEELSDYLLQLIQVLKYEPYHDSSLARFLLRRALRNRRIIGHSFFWFLKAEMHVHEISERFSLLLEAYLRGCGTHRAELHKQAGLLTGLVKSANMIKSLKDQERLPSLQEELGKIQFPTKIQLPLDPSIEVSGIKVEKCKYMDSKKLPLWVVFQNADANGAPKYVIFKSGDDLRQDMLTLQMIRLMDKLWKREGLDLQLNPYGCISTGDEEGFIEVVLNSNTIANITKNAGGATAAFKADPLANWIRSNNPQDNQYNKAVDNFILSCAGYCVATYVLGVGDRHNDNVMITKEGRFFHIDFGHFLGNFKKKLGFKRERAPFVFTPDFAHVMGGRDSKDFMKFVDICCKAYNILRKHANVFINLFAMMLSTGIPELTSVDDISYLREAFSLDANDEKAREKFKSLIYESLATVTTQLNNAIHILAH